MNEGCGRYDNINGDEDEIAYDRWQRYESKKEQAAEDWFASAEACLREEE